MAFLSSVLLVIIVNSVQTLKGPDVSFFECNPQQSGNLQADLAGKQQYDQLLKLLNQSKTVLGLRAEQANRVIYIVALPDARCSLCP
jgi:hypothetical protein